MKTSKDNVGPGLSFDAWWAAVDLYKIVDRLSPIAKGAYEDYKSGKDTRLKQVAGDDR